jgi:hypothetical protein
MKTEIQISDSTENSEEPPKLSVPVENPPDAAILPP